MLRLAFGIILIIAGLVWILQGFDVVFAPESFMTGNRWWVVWGGAALASGGAMVWWQRRSI